MNNLYYILILNFSILYLFFWLSIRKHFWYIYSYPTKEGKKVKSSKVYSGLGLACVLGSIFSFLIFMQINNYDIKSFNFFLIFLIFATFIGLLDDILDLDPYLKLIIIFFICLFISFSYLAELKDIKDKIYLLMTFFLILVYFNSINFVDGSDGFLLCHIFFFTLGSILIITNVNIEILDNYLIFLLIFLSSCLALLYFNLSGKAIIGNTGSFAAGVVLCYFGVLYIRNGLTYQLLILIMYPLTDVVLSLLKKIIIKKQLFKKDFCYFFLKPIKNKGKSHFYVFNSFLIYNIFNFFSLYLSILINAQVGLSFSIIISSILILHFEKN
jgi:UDP-GlcNAc:undecaprenyl-phosphate/decaprenyl-phosphate GlcNAc-1-phosphate transferase